MPKTFLVLAMAAICCATARQWAAGRDWRAYDRGRHIAQTRCAACHAIGGQTSSPKPQAPAFVSLATRFDEKGLSWELEAIATTGHYGMPPTPTTAAEREALAAYIKGLDPRAARAIRGVRIDRR